jgi:hypothetical protein
MEFIKKNYEKVILGAVLLGLVAVLAFMPFVISYDQQKTRELPGIITRKPDPLPPLDLSAQQSALDRLKSPYLLDFSTTNKLFNPVQWQRTKDGRVAKSGGLGPTAAVVGKITPLYYSITLDSVATNALGIPPRYTFVVEHQAAAQPALRHAQRQYASPGEKVRDFTLKEVKGAPENPDMLVLKLADTGETATLSKSQPFRRVDGYTADLKYDPDKLNATAVRVGERLAFAGDDYNVIAIGANEVILLAQSNQKKYSLRYSP